MSHWPCSSLLLGLDFHLSQKTEDTKLRVSQQSLTSKQRNQTTTITMDSNLTAHSVLKSTLHDRERRQERQIDKITLQEARRYGIRDRQGGANKDRVRYFYAGHVFIYDERQNKAITSYKYDRISDLYHPKDPGSRPRTNKKPIQSGTRFTRPIFLEKSKDHCDAGIRSAHESAAEFIQQNLHLWKSHTVIVVDMSGSMREDDVNGARCRADGVWTTLARNFCRQQLEDESSSMYDVVSVITMRSEAEVVIWCEPLTWVLYNKLVQFREVSVLRFCFLSLYKKIAWPEEYLPSSIMKLIYLLVTE